MVTAASSNTSPVTQSEVATNTTTQPKQLASKETFLQLLVAQIKNQNPLNPADGVQFLSQLAQFSELEQLMDMGANISKIAESVTAEAPESSSGTDSNGTTANGA
jgi:flagellar basal-body rod modification protein FlgD